jgi:putative oxidoreductase
MAIRKCALTGTDWKNYRQVHGVLEYGPQDQPGEKSMKIVVIVTRILLGLPFVIFGANGLYPFLSHPDLPPGLAAQFVTALSQSHYAIVPFLVQLIGGILLLVNRFVPLALTLLGPVIVNILCFHAFMEPGGLPLACVVAILWFILFYVYRKSFEGLFVQNPTL